MSDMSHLDSQYFVEATTYNCPFCNRRSVFFLVTDDFAFHWSHGSVCYGYLVKCGSCQQVSMHLSHEEMRLGLYPGGNGKFFTTSDLDGKFFYSHPTSFFVMDERIPAVLRQLMSEAESCLKMNLLTGASACARKVVYELARIEGASGANYEDRLKSLKSVRTDLDGTHFDNLLSVQQVTSTKVHEDAYDGWRAEHLRVILATLSEVLRLLYVEPKVREERRAALLKLKNEVMPPKEPPAAAKGDN